MEIDEFLSTLPKSIVSGEAVSLPDNLVRKILKFAKLKRSDVFYHLGCGEGNAIRIAATEFGVKKSVGIEIKRKIAANARKQISGIKNVEIITADIRKTDISDATVVLFWFNDPKIVEKMMTRFKRLKDGIRVITIWAPLGTTLPNRIDFPFFVSKTPFKPSKSMEQQIKAIYGNPCIDFTAAWLLAERYIDALEVVPSDYRRFVNMLQGMVIWINAWNMGVACEDEVPPPVGTYIGILKTFFNIDLSNMIKAQK